MTDITIDKFDESFMVVHTAHNGILYDMNDYFAFYAKNYRHMPKFKMGIWDGKIRLLNITTHMMHSGLIHEVIKYALDNDLSLDIDPDFDLPDVNYVPAVDLESLFKSFNLPFTAHDYQVEAIEMILKHRKRLVLSPTSSGKSLIIYGAIRALMADTAAPAPKILLVVPTTSLVEQMVGDFKDYSENNDFDSDSMCHMIYSGKEKRNDKPITVTTWQSVYKKRKDWFKNFDAVFVDEAHLASAESITAIMDKCEKAKIRVGLTGTIEDTQTHKMTLIGLFGRIWETITTKQLMDKGLVSKLKIKGVIFNHSDTEKQQVTGFDYVNEIDHIVTDDRKNRFIAKLALSQSGNTLVLFNLVEGHGIPLFKLINKLNTKGKTVFFVSGDTPVKERERIRAHTESHDGVIIVASYGTFSTGINIKNLDAAIFAHPFKAKIKILQSIGRVLRIGKSGKALLYDLASDFRWKSKTNHTMKHFKDRLKLYEAQKFDYSISVVKL